MRKVYLIFGCHCHQPLGNFDHVIERIYSDSYLPFLQAASGHPGIKLVLHYSGALLEWIDRNHPEFIGLVRDMVQRNQVEILAGSFYEAVLASIPENDQIEQVKRFTDFIESKFMTTPRGIWLAERVWEPKLAKTLPAAGMEYALVDDFHFKTAGLKNEQLWDFFRVEEEGHYFSLFPISERLRYLTPFERVKKSIQYLGQTAESGNNPLLVIVDDGEKFGSWPGTKKWVYEDGWLEDFFSALEENRSWIETRTLSEYIQEFQPGGLIYLPIGSYFEMGEWSLPSERALAYTDLMLKLQKDNLLEENKGFLKGGIWRGFFMKYPESNHLHKKMLALSQTIHGLQKDKGNNPTDKGLLDLAYSELLKSQCNDAYWHGVFGGLYLPHLRHAIFRHLIQGERYVDQAVHGGREAWCESVTADFDGDGHQDVILNNPWLRACFDPAEGGILVELDYKPSNFNLINTLARRFEAYHRSLDASGEGEPSHPDQDHSSIHDRDKSTAADSLKGRLFYDKNRKASFVDHFFPKDTDLERFKNAQYMELGDFSEGAYTFHPENQEKRVLLTLSRSGKIDLDSICPFQIVKKIQMVYNEGSLYVAYEITNRSGKLLDLCFGVEMNFSLLSGQNPDIFMWFPDNPGHTFAAASSGIKEGMKDIHISNKIENFSLSLETERSVSFWWFPVETVSQSEKGYDLTYQSTVIMPTWELRLLPEDCWRTRLKLSVNPLVNPGLKNQ